MTRSPPAALLLKSTHCPYCPTVLAALQSLEADNAIGELQVINIEEQPELASELGVRSVPWTRIGPFELDGLRTEQELRTWAQKAGTTEGLSAWMEELLTKGKLKNVTELVISDSSGFDGLLLLFAHPDTALNTRIGISAVIESLQESDLLKDNLDKLESLTSNPEPQIRGDACHFLALSNVPGAIEIIEPLLNDADPDVAEIARESIDTLKQNLQR